MLEATLIGARVLSSNVRELTFEASPDFSFQPGQWVHVHFPGHYDVHGELLKRSYSIASAPRANGRFDLSVARTGSGPAGTLLHAAAIGERFSITGPFGEFLMAPIERPFLMVATGTGIAPFRAMLQASAMRARRRMALLFGNRDETEILYECEFEALARENPLFMFFPTLSRPGVGWNGRIGYVQSHVCEIAGTVGGPHCDAYICGQPAMVREVRSALHEHLGVDWAHIHVERYG